MEVNQRLCLSEKFRAGVWWGVRCFDFRVPIIMVLIFRSVGQYAICLIGHRIYILNPEILDS